MTSERVRPLVGAASSPRWFWGVVGAPPFLVPVAWAAILAYTTRRCTGNSKPGFVEAGVGSLLRTVLLILPCRPVILLSLRWR